MSETARRIAGIAEMDADPSSYWSPIRAESASAPEPAEDRQMSDKQDFQFYKGGITFFPLEAFDAYPPRRPRQGITSRLFRWLKGGFLIRSARRP